MKKQIIYSILFMLMLTFINAECGGPKVEKPPYYFKCFANGAYNEYLVTSAYYNASKNITKLQGSSDLYGSMEIVWTGQKLSSGEIIIDGSDNSENAPYLWITNGLESLDTFKTNTFKYKLMKYDGVQGKIQGEFSATIKCDSLGYLLDTINIDINYDPVQDTTIYDTTEVQMLKYRKVPEFSIYISGGEFSIYRSPDK